ncbi:MAG: tetratricopeptide repeat protein [Thermodesulfobacteriota bacterium]
MRRAFFYLCMLGMLLAGSAGCSLLIKGDYKFQTKDYAGAIADFTAYLEKNPNSFQAKYMLGRSYLEAGETDKAVAMFQEALALKPGDPQAILFLGTAFVAKGDHEKAIAAFESFKDPGRPLLEKEVRQQLTLLKIEYNKKLAKEAIASEKKLATVKPAAETYAVCYYEDKTPGKNLAAFQKALAAMTISNLSQISSIQVVERLRLQALMEEMALGTTGIVDPKAAPRLGRLLGAEHLIVGTISQDIRTDTALASTAKGKVIGNAALTVKRDRFFELPGAIAASVVKMKGIQLNPTEQAAINEGHTKNIDAVLYYGSALDAMDKADWKTALDFFNKALAADPQFQLALLGRDSCPSGDSSTGTGGVTPQSLKSRFDAAIAAQATADQAKKESLTGVGSGGGGH